MTGRGWPGPDGGKLPEGHQLPTGGSAVQPPPGMSEAVVWDALRLMQVLASLKLPKNTRLVGTREGTEVHRRDGVSYLVRPITPRFPAAES